MLVGRLGSIEVAFQRSSYSQHLLSHHNLGHQVWRYIGWSTCAYISIYCQHKLERYLEGRPRTHCYDTDLERPPTHTLLLWHRFGCTLLVDQKSSCESLAGIYASSLLAYTAIVGDDKRTLHTAGGSPQSLHNELKPRSFWGNLTTFVDPWFRKNSAVDWGTKLWASAPQWKREMPIG